MGLQCAVSFFVLLMAGSGVLSWTCEKGWQFANGRCYYVSRDELDFYSALSFCKVYSGSLVEMDDIQEYNAVKMIAKAHNVKEFWVGVTDMFVEGHWMKAYSMTPQNFFKWKAGEPNNYGRYEHCTIQESSGTWNDHSCTAHRHFVCYTEFD